MKILALDPAASTGYAIARVDDNTADIYEYGFIEVDTASEYNGDRCIELMQKVEEIINAHDIDEVCIEDYFFSKRFANGCEANAAYRTALHILCRQKNLNYTILNIGNWKKFVAGRASPAPDQKKKWGKEPAKKLYMQQALWDNYGFRFPNHSISKKTGKPIKFRYDIVDAVAQCVFFCQLYHRIPEVKLSMTIPSDVDIKRIKTVFKYPKEV